MHHSRYLDAKAFINEAKKLHVIRGFHDKKLLERLEKQRSLIPRLRLHYPDPIERRWFAEAHPDLSVGGELELDGEIWDTACNLEQQRDRIRWSIDPTSNPHVLDNPEIRFMQFIEQPAKREFVPWAAYRVAVNAADEAPLYTSETDVTYYTSWQLLQFAEVADMGVHIFMNIGEVGISPSDAELLAAPRSTSFMPIHALRGFVEHEAALDAIVWFAEEANLGELFATSLGGGRRMLTEKERAEIMRTRLHSAQKAQERYGVGSEEILKANRFLFEQWIDWNHEGRPLIADAYKSVAAQGVRLGCLASNSEVDNYREQVGRLGGHFAPIMDVIWPDWESEQRQNARRILTSYRRDSSVLCADFSDELVDRFLDHVEAHELQGFYWRLESFNRHAFKGNNRSLEGLKGDVQGIAVVIEHIVSSLGSDRTQLRDKFKELWASNPSILKLLKSNKVMKVGQGKDIDLGWFEERDAQGGDIATAADLAILYAIRGGAHRVIAETDPLKLERMMLIMLRGIVKTFAAATNEGETPAQAYEEETASAAT